MNLVLTRIDNRLIHGQVLEAWVPFVRADCIVVANDDIAGNPLKKMMMQVSVPSRIRVEIGTVAESVALLKSTKLDCCRVLLLFGTTADAVSAYREGLVYSRLNLGNLQADKGKERFSCTLFLNPSDLDDLEILDQAGIKITSRCVPAESERSWRKLIPACKGKK
ncbi:PTS system, mannose-specific IIB component [Desulfuromusa kysingii]|uniref:PTS system, mannose-specific IIB component n=1 Tax=Desulfuromusa kysingii TaxID=37625 RepID=A0A1H3ZNA4_9BACT|nr:PTS sugar transporter subunit IIB [Desulfuromusa kysingii]SEA25135.1 PTS system, mannose-specific IIB component [Desulfuromusa kysingii]